jgi:ABC-type multidrug transport system fused ATPase/permease subunit
VITLPDAVPASYDVRSPGGLLLGLAARQRQTLATGSLLGVGWMLCHAFVPVLVGRTVDAGLVQRSGRDLAVGCAAIAVLGALTAVVGVLRHRVAMANWMQAALRTQQLVAHRVADHGEAVASGTTTGEVVESVSEDATRIADPFDVFARATGAVVTYVVVTVVLLRTDALLGVWVAIGLPLLTATLVMVIRPLQDRQKRHRANEGELTALGADLVTGLRVLRGIGGEPEFLARYRARSRQVRAAGERVATPQAVLDAAHVLLPGVFVVVLTWIAAHAVLAGRLTPGELVTVYGLAAFLRLPLETATEALSKGVRAWVAAGRVVAILGRTAPAAVLGDPPPVATGALTALVGDDPEAVAALAAALGDGSPGTHFPPRVLVSEAEPRLFSGTLRAGLDPYRRHTDEQITAAVTVADAGDVLAALPAGLDTTVEERGRSFSGGQRQRLVLARAVLADPDVLVLLEPTSAVDAHTEARVARRLRAARAGRTTVVTTTSPLLLAECDRVLLVDGGRVLATGTHRELLADPRYRHVVVRPDGPLPATGRTTTGTTGTDARGAGR